MLDRLEHISIYQLEAQSDANIEPYRQINPHFMYQYSGVFTDVCQIYREEEGAKKKNTKSG